VRIFELHIFGLTIAPTYYGLAYALGILGAYLWIKYRQVMNEAHLDFLALCVVSGIILGGRLGYIVFYDLGYYLAQPLKMLALYE
jgi:phosphatidylglycerol---prolipoprotein diacylglyceryl transferase